MMGSSIHDSRKLNVAKVNSSYQLYIPPAGVINAAEGLSGQQPEAERILAMNPEMIFFDSVNEKVQDFTRDPRWKGLKAVREKRVYKMPGPFSGILAGLHLQPLRVRCMAEIAHPRRLQQKLRATMRGHFVQALDCRLSDEQIDSLLHIDENKDQPGYRRFSSDFAARHKQSAAEMGWPEGFRYRSFNPQ